MFNFAFMFLSSGFYRNGEDVQFHYPEVMELALSVMETATFYDKYIKPHHGFILEFRNREYEVRIVLEGFLEGECSVRSIR